jgi:hypothetical protein
LVNNPSSSTKTIKTLTIKSIYFITNCKITYAKMFMLYGTITDSTFILDDFKIESSTMGDAPNKDNSVFIDLGGSL